MASRYLFAVGRRNRSTVNVKLYPGGTGNLVVHKPNGSTISLKDYFGGNEYLYENAVYPLLILNKDAIHNYDADIEICGGGLKGHSDSIKLAFARAFVTMDTGLRVTMKPYGLLKRDPRRREREKPGLRGARRRPQWSKR
ncbi:MAG: uS9 family ribosomal protein [Candidatus Absconditabacterales bacterium]